MISEIPYAIIISGVALVGLWISNILFDLKVPHYLSRKIGHSAGGVGFLLFGFFFKSAFWPILLSALFTMLFGAARIFRPNTFRGVGGSGRSQNVIAEIWFVGVALPVLLIGWLWLDKPFIAIACNGGLFCVLAFPPRIFCPDEEGLQKSRRFYRHFCRIVFDSPCPWPGFGIGYDNKISL